MHKVAIVHSVRKELGRDFPVPLSCGGTCTAMKGGPASVIRAPKATLIVSVPT